MSFRSLLFLLMALLALGLILPLTASAESGGGQGFSAVPMYPDVVDALRAQGKKIRTVFPNSINQGKKFVPGGSVVGQLTTNPEQKVLVIFVEFGTLPPGGPSTRMDLTYYDDLLSGTVYNPPEYNGYPDAPTDRTLKNYYQAVSYGKVDVVTLNMPSSMGWTNVGHPYDYYCKADGVHDNGFGPYPNNVPGMIWDALTLLDSKIDFSQYAIEGEVPNLFVVFAGTGAEWSGAYDLIWSHSWSLSSGGPGPFIADGVKIDHYAVMPEVGGDLTGFAGAPSGPYPPTVGVFAHEYGHVLGLPDQYDYGYESDGTSIFSLMAGGSWNRYPSYTGSAIFSGNSPAFLDAWSRYRLGFVTPIEVTGNLSGVLPPAETDSVVYRMTVPFSGGKEYFLFENRQQIGFDQGLYRFGASVHGLAIYHIDDVVLNRTYWRPNEAENWKEFRSEGARKAWTGETHYGISLIQADDRWDLEKYVYTLAGFRNDLYPGPLGVTSFGNNTLPNSSSYYFWGGSSPKFGFSGVTVRNITENGGTVKADFSFQPWAPVTK